MIGTEVHIVGPGWWFVGLIPLLFWGAIIGLIIALVMRHDRPSSHTHSHPYQGPPPGPHMPPAPPRGPQAISILEERYARGEISREEFVERRAVLLGVAPATPAAGAPAPQTVPPPTTPAPPPAPSAGELILPGEPPATPPSPPIS